MGISSICRSCHHPRKVDGSRTCASCAARLRAEEQRRPSPPTIEPIVAEVVRAGLVRLPEEPSDVQVAKMGATP